MGRSPGLFGFLFLVVFSATSEVFTEAQQQADKPKLLQQSVVDEVNSNPDAGWIAHMHPHMAHYHDDDISSLLGAIIPDDVKQQKNAVVQHYEDPAQPENVTLPKNYDARTAYPYCENTIGLIRYQGHCGSCWAFSTTGVLQDRICIKYNISVVLSPNELLACCGRVCALGCKGGQPVLAWEYIYENGIHTEECYPYFDQGGCSNKSGGCPVSPVAPHCVRQCQPGSQQSWNNNTVKYWSDQYYFVSLATGLQVTQDMMKEIYLYGPLQAAMDVYSDFIPYKSGVYRHVTGGFLGRHAIRIIGWGTTDDEVDYWLVANSWNSQWGENGFFRISRGTDEAGIESLLLIGANPLLKTL